MFTMVSTILKVPANEAVREFDSEYDAALLLKESIMEPFKDMLVILICCDIVHANEEVHQIQMDKVLVDWGRSSKRGNKS